MGMLDEGCKKYFGNPKRFAALEPENYVNYAEAVKIMGYDFGRYDRQVQDIRKEREKDAGRRAMSLS